jgi:hypothetical protein
MSNYINVYLHQLVELNPSHYKSISEVGQPTIHFSADSEACFSINSGQTELTTRGHTGKTYDIEKEGYVEFILEKDPLVFSDIKRKHSRKNEKRLRGRPNGM